MPHLKEISEKVVISGIENYEVRLRRTFFIFSGGDGL